MKTIEEFGYFKYLSSMIKKRMQVLHGKLNVILAWQKLHPKIIYTFQQQTVLYFWKKLIKF